MKRSLFLRSAVVAAAALLPASTLMAAAPSAAVEPHLVRDIALREGGAFHGQLMDQAGAPLAGSEVAIYSEGRLVANATTDAQGNFVITGLNGGTYIVAAQGAEYAYRLWTLGSAPPMAQDTALVISETDLVRGQILGALGGVSMGTVAVGVTAGGLGWGIYQVTQDNNSGS